MRGAYSQSMSNITSSIISWVKSHPLLAGLGFVLLAPSFVFGLVFDILGFIGWGRIFLALLIVGGYVAFRFAKSQLDEYKDTADDALSFARELKDEFYN